MYRKSMYNERRDRDPKLDIKDIGAIIPKETVAIPSLTTIPSSLMTLSHTRKNVRKIRLIKRKQYTMESTSIDTELILFNCLQ